MRAALAVACLVSSLGCSSAPEPARPDGPTRGSVSPNPPVNPSARVLVFDEAEATLSHTRHTEYQHETYIDEATGTFDVDCSGLVNYVLEEAAPEAFVELQTATLERPLSENYVKYIDSPSLGVHWQRLAAPRDLLPGDIVAWIEPPGLHSVDTGHVMVVAAPPVVGSREVDVTVIDSAESGHGPSDPRTVQGTSGVGKGTMVLTVNSAGVATGYRWSTESYSVPYVTPVALGRLE
jgi:hypothetical protein